MNAHAHTEFKNEAEEIETKEAVDTDLEQKFGEYHEATAAAIKAAEDRADELEARMNRLSFGGGMDTKAAGELKVKKEHAAFGRFIKTGDETELKSMSAGNDTEGGYLVGTNLATTINSRIFDQSPIRRLARVIPLTSGSEWSEPTDFDDLGAEWVAEKVARTETDNADIGMVTIPLNEIYAHQTVTQKLLDLSFADVGGWIENKIADKFARTEGVSYVTGNGVGKPRGFLDYATSADPDATRAAWTLQFVNSGSATTVSDADGQANGIVDLFWALNAAYRRNATWVMSSATANAVDKLKDSNKQYIWRNGMTAGAQPELLGRPVEIDENMPAPGAGTLPIAFGDFAKAYTVVDWSGIKSIRDPYSDKPNVIFYSYRRTGGGLSNPYAVKLLKCAAS